MQNTEIPTNGGGGGIEGHQQSQYTNNNNDNDDSNNGISSCYSFLPSSMHDKLNELISQIHRVELDDAKGRVHRGWAIVLIFLTLIFFTGIFESTTIQTSNGPDSLALAAIWSSVVHGILAILGTFIIRRFPTQFAIGFFLGLLVIIAQQDIIIHSTFKQYKQTMRKSGGFFSFLSMIVALLLVGFTAFLAIYRDAILLTSPVDNTGHGGIEDDNRYHEGLRDEDLS